MTTEEKEKLSLQMIQLADDIINGTAVKYELSECLDSYYNDAFPKKLLDSIS